MGTSSADTNESCVTFETLEKLSLCIWLPAVTENLGMGSRLFTSTQEDHVGAQSFSCVRLFATPWTVARQAPLSVGFSWARTLEWAAISSSRGSFRPRDQIHVSCMAGGFFTSEAAGKPLGTSINTPQAGDWSTDNLTAPCSSGDWIWACGSRFRGPSPITLIAIHTAPTLLTWLCEWRVLSLPTKHLSTHHRPRGEGGVGPRQKRTEGKRKENPSSSATWRAVTNEIKPLCLLEPVSLGRCDLAPNVTETIVTGKTRCGCVTRKARDKLKQKALSKVPLRTPTWEFPRADFFP